ncbi:DUF1989 domain-containing protein [Streptomyces sp. ActVer]|uniref:DUF1989 domain-containing protein n=1 Tax=Streptomyces sp. ActVer TaxID=3014558 RepID=UPI0022B3FB79|nr:DUF1989 domain-containing protein [Streptomyces sp. ActVer]MCZ4513879.1 DUF1989 domain-containing protein [Streptomyces sp. ActVer]
MLHLLGTRCDPYVKCTGLNDDDQYFMKGCPARKGDYFEFFAETDLLCALSACPGGDLSVPLWGPDARDPLDVCRPLGIEVHRPDPALLDGWTSPRRAAYRNLHGMGRPEFVRAADRTPWDVSAPGSRRSSPAP